MGSVYETGSQRLKIKILYIEKLEYQICMKHRGDAGNPYTIMTGTNLENFIKTHAKELFTGGKTV